MAPKFCLLSGLCLSLMGCGTFSVTTPPPIPKADPAETTLAEAAVAVTESLHELAELRRAATPAGKKIVNAETYGHIPGIISVDWSGPVEPLLRKVATVPHFTFRVIGNKPAIPVLVSITKVNAPVSEILRDIDYQIGNQANVRVYADAHVIELRYSKVS